MDSENWGCALVMIVGIVCFTVLMLAKMGVIHGG